MRKNRLLTLLGAATLATSVPAFANEGLYLGPSLTLYYLDSDRVISGHERASDLGLNLGYRFAEDWAVELGYATKMMGDDLDVSRLNLLHYLGEDKGQGTWRPYVLAGVSYFERGSDANLQPGEDDTQQASLGLGIANQASDHVEFRVDARVLQKIRDGQDDTTDGALNLQINYYFDGPAPAPVAEAPVSRAAPVAPAVEEEPEVRTITVRLNVEFEFNKADVRAIYGQELGAIANAMKNHDDIDLVLEGHTDNKGADDYNQSLSERRAAAVKAKLVEDYGIDASRVSTVGYGESRPIADNSTEDGRARNRRVIGEMSYSEVMPD